jgi:pullulanase/glycogen debranching enzyme
MDRILFDSHGGHVVQPFLVVKDVPNAQDINPAGNFGQSAPLGSTVCHGGVIFSLFSREACGVDLLFFDRQDDARPARVISLDPSLNRT